MESANKGRVPCLKCKSCGEKPPMKSNRGIAEELVRIAAPLKALEDFGCIRKDCINHDKSVLENPECYQKYGYRVDTDDPIKCCRACDTKFTVRVAPPRIHNKNRHLAVDVYSRVVNKSPVKRTLIGANLPSLDSYYKIIRFIFLRLTPYLKHRISIGRLSIHPAKKFTKHG